MNIEYMFLYDQLMQLVKTWFSWVFFNQEKVEKKNSFLPSLSVFSSTVARMREVPLNKLDREIKPYSLMEREGKDCLDLSFSICLQFISSFLFLLSLWFNFRNLKRHQGIFDCLIADVWMINIKMIECFV